MQLTFLSHKLVVGEGRPDQLIDHAGDQGVDNALCNLLDVEATRGHSVLATRMCRCAGHKITHLTLAVLEKGTEIYTIR